MRSLSLGVVLQDPAKRLSASANAQFAALSATLSPAAKASLTKLVAATGRTAVRTEVVGYVQGTKVTTNDKDLSARRARAVAAYLKGLGLKSVYVVRGNGVAKDTGPGARRVGVAVTYYRK